MPSGKPGRYGGGPFDAPVIIEAAINGATTKSQNPHVPKTAEEIAADAMACLDAGASIIHAHCDPVGGTDDAVASPAAAQAFAARTHASYASFPGGHFVLLVRREDTLKAIAGWLMGQLGLHETGTAHR